MLSRIERELLRSRPTGILTRKRTIRPLTKREREEGDKSTVLRKIVGNEILSDNPILPYLSKVNEASYDELKGVVEEAHGRFYNYRQDIEICEKYGYIKKTDQGRYTLTDDGKKRLNLL